MAYSKLSAGELNVCVCLYEYTYTHNVNILVISLLDRNKCREYFFSIYLVDGQKLIKKKSCTQVLWSFELELEPRHLTWGQSVYWTVVALPRLGCGYVHSCWHMRPHHSFSMVSSGLVTDQLSTFFHITPFASFREIYLDGKIIPDGRGYMSSSCASNLSQRLLTFFIRVFRLVFLKQLSSL